MPSAWSTRSTCSSRSTSATWSRRCCSITSRRRCGARALRALGARRAATSRGSGCRRSAGMLARPRRRRAGRGDRARWRDQQRGRRDARRGRCWPIPTRASAPPRRSALAGSARPDGRRRRRSGAARPDRATRRDGARARRGATSPLAIRQIADPRFRRLLIPLLYDPAPDVADEAMESVQRRRHGRLRLRADAGLAAAQPPAEGHARATCWSATASRSSTRSRTSCAIRTKTSGCAATSRRRWR